MVLGLSPEPMITSTDAYLAYVKRCLENHPNIDDAMRFVVSTNGQSIKERGEEELAFLIREGLKPGDYLIDVGCGAGALLQAGVADHCAEYAGLDIHPAIVDHANHWGDSKHRAFCCELLGCDPGTADWVVFFSVFTHLMDHEIYRYLQEAFDVLKPGGRCVFTYRDWADPGQWSVFMNMVKADNDPTKILIYDNLLRGQTIRQWLKVIGFDKSLFYHPNVQVPQCVLGQTTVVAVKP